MCANCHVGSVNGDISRILIHKTDCVLCRRKVGDLTWLKREPVITGKVTDDREPFESIVPIPPQGNAPVTTRCREDVDLKEESSRLAGGGGGPGGGPGAGAAGGGGGGGRGGL